MGHCVSCTVAMGLREAMAVLPEKCSHHLRSLPTVHISVSAFPDLILLDTGSADERVDDQASLSSSGRHTPGHLHRPNTHTPYHFEKPLLLTAFVGTTAAMEVAPSAPEPPASPSRDVARGRKRSWFELGSQQPADPQEDVKRRRTDLLRWRCI